VYLIDNTVYLYDWSIFDRFVTGLTIALMVDSCPHFLHRVIHRKCG